MNRPGTETSIAAPLWVSLLLASCLSWPRSKGPSLAVPPSGSTRGEAWAVFDNPRHPWRIGDPTRAEVSPRPANAFC